MNNKARTHFNISGQHLTELALVFAVVTATLVGMRLYLQRSLQARYKSGVNYMFSRIEDEAAHAGKPHLFGLSRQYEPSYHEIYRNEDFSRNQAGGFDVTAGGTGAGDRAANERTNAVGWERLGVE